MDHAVAALDVGLHDLCIIDLDTAIGHLDLHSLALHCLCFLQLDHVSCLHVACNNMIGQDGNQLVLVLRLQQALNRSFRQFGECFVGWSENCERPVTLHCVVLGHQKGRDTKERALRNFGMTKPEGYRKALRLMKLAEKFRMPVFTFVDTPGAYPGIDAEERGQSEAIGRNIFEMAQLETPIISTIIGEGGSGGALAIAVGDQTLMLQHAVYSVISPEGCASILWKTSDKAEEAAEALGIVAPRLKALGLVDKIVSEPTGGAHRDHKAMMGLLSKGLSDALRQVSGLKTEELLQRRYERLQSFGRFTEKA